jgi:hypothetical protein
MLTNMGPNAGEQLKAMAGMEGTDVPGKMALINTVLDSVTEDVAEQLLTEFINDLYV